MKIPRKLLYQDDQKKLLDHFINDIKGDDRYLRFGYNAKDEMVADYISKATLYFGSSNMWFVIEDEDKFVGTVHVNIHASADLKKVAEMGFTVSPEYRNKGIAQHLFYRGSTWASMKGANTIYTHCLSQNKVMQHIARKNGMTVITLDEGEKEANIKVTKGILKSYYEDLTLDNITFVDYSVKKQQSMIKSLLLLP